MKKSELRNIIKEEIQRLNEKSDINRFNMFGFNYPNDFIDKVYSDLGENMINHLKDKFSSFYKKYGAVGAFPYFYSYLDAGKQQQLEQWVLKNFKG